MSPPPLLPAPDLCIVKPGKGLGRGRKHPAKQVGHTSPWPYLRVSNHHCMSAVSCVFLRMSDCQKEKSRVKVEGGASG